MVLTQLMVGKKGRHTILCFHTTMVLTQPGQSFCGFSKSSGFHTTMVLTQQLLLQKLYRIGGGEVKSIEFLC